ncbi:MAG: DUF1858 domain-containing protein [Bacteroidia bacterium]|nr:DUF1858 domain-containing protein [Bacteroidia bacterium]
MKRDIINPQMKVGDLLDQYPELEETLISIAPAFSKLKNPVLRRTIARVATLQQAALTGNVPVHEVVNTLRTAAGQTKDDDASQSPIAARDAESVPAWLSGATERVEFDARPVLASGAHPLQEVFARLQQLPQGAVLDLITPFYPAPLVDAVRGKGWDAIHTERGKDLFVTTIGRP